MRAVSSAVERLVYTERVGGSNPSPPIPAPGGTLPGGTLPGETLAGDVEFGAQVA